MSDLTFRAADRRFAGSRRLFQGLASWYVLFMASADQNERKVVLKGHEVIVHTAPTPDGGYYAFAVLLDPFANGGEMKSFEARAGSEGEAEVRCAEQALQYLEQAVPNPPPAQSFKASRATLEVLGRRVDIYCDWVGQQKFQAFPFLYRPDGKRVVIIRFHLDEAIVGVTAEEAREKCVARLEQYFREESARAPAPDRPPKAS